ncbi:NAD-dependent succinate-semialdehyde dehydrogenase [Rudaeicoccus suwonensis]|uniref:Succinate-semialdehyde dehydrogenase/glutarate-semialdehyde dehydrogenase n=1 Tax=Rudaeicoccus suwonensis TaxID=657409 RepID=A0A561E9F5_9MICO|nr:NAD-dependent succinate-semialdehyde dehydrogenase [Rudaeicoccus suwonensis]TWE12242.1 succinate-semialdehyde dehydrogenase/glutarate-semialdehyde dehydrogenase [Rudaeicoccus suwonensis]
MANQTSIVDKVNKQLLIGGTWRDSADGTTLEVDNPATGGVLARVADATVADGAAALTAAADAQAEWARSAPRDRSELLRSAYELIVERTDEFAELMTLEMGKPLAEARGEVVYGSEFFRWFAEEAVRISGRWSTAPNGATRLMTMKQPVGPTLMITPWNFPLAMGTRKIGPAIAAGCTMVVKPAAETPLTMLYLAQVLQEVGLPDGVLNIVTTSHSGEVMEPLIRDSRTRKLTFTGSTPVGRKLVEQSADQLLRLSMELGGNAPFIVFEDADIDKAVEGAMLAKMRNIGEACTAANRFFVHEDVAAEFGRKFAAKMTETTVGNGMDDGVTVGPLINRKAVDKVTDMVTDATARGAEVVTGGTRIEGDGYFFAPTVLTGVPGDAQMAREEIFGPVAGIQTFTDEADVIRRANDTEFGLVAYFFTRDVSRTIRMSEALEYGMVGVNQGIVSNPAAPFGGVKASGFGREGGFEGIEEYLETKYVGLAL